ncbi:MAG: class I SAM-dependent methyltransferase [Pseudonocardiaceae bacterium]|nr:class I SAM-dependent methyltransferase [Pseudonocardiaceae bacterium]
MLRYIRHALRDRLIRAVEEVSERHHRAAVELAERHHREQLAALRREGDRVITAVRTAVHESEIRSRRDLFAAGERDAVAASARFAREVMPTVPTFPYPQATLEHALSLAPAEGMALEFGVFSGQTLKVIAEAREGHGVYGFDSFEGLPENWRTGFPTGAFRVDGIPDVPGAELLVGWFDDVLPGFLAEHPGPVALLHVDSDLYSSARTVLDQVGPRLVPGSVVLFDEYFNYPGWERHEHLAWQEYVERTGTRFEYEGYTINNEQVFVRVTEVGGRQPSPGRTQPAS